MYNNFLVSKSKSETLYVCTKIENKTDKSLTKALESIKNSDLLVLSIFLDLCNKGCAAAVACFKYLSSYGFELRRVDIK